MVSLSVKISRSDWLAKNGLTLEKPLTKIPKQNQKKRFVAIFIQTENKFTFLKVLVGKLLRTKVHWKFEHGPHIVEADCKTFFLIPFLTG